MPHRSDAYQEYSDEEHLLILLLFGGAVGSGILSIMGRVTNTRRAGIPRSLQPPGGNRIQTTLAIRGRQVGAFTGSVWWIKLWADLTAAAEQLFGRISQTSAARALLPFSTAGISADLAVELARRHAREMVAALQVKTAEGLAEALAAIGPRPPGGLVQALADRLGPTSAQIARIRLGEATRIAAGMERRELRRWIRSQTRNASAARARGFAGEAIVTEVTRAEVAAWEAVGGVLVFSANAGDARVRALHRTQTAVTRATPLPAGSGFAPGAPFQLPPPYAINCRCRIRPV